MRKFLALLLLCISTITFADTNNLKEAKEPPVDDCVVTLKATDCMSSSPKIVECYRASWSGGKETWFIYVNSVPYGMGDGYAIYYSEGSSSQLQCYDRKAFATKKEAISYFVKNVVGSSCKYVFE